MKFIRNIGFILKLNTFIVCAFIICVWACVLVLKLFYEKNVLKTKQEICNNVISCEMTLNGCEATQPYINTISVVRSIVGIHFNYLHTDASLILSTQLHLLWKLNTESLHLTGGIENMHIFRYFTNLWWICGNEFERVSIWSALISHENSILAHNATLFAFFPEFWFLWSF